MVYDSKDSAKSQHSKTYAPKEFIECCKNLHIQKLLKWTHM